MLVVLSAAFILVDLFVVIMQVTVSAEIMQNIWVTNFIEIMHVEVSVTMMQVVVSTVHYVHDYFYCNYAGDWL